MAQSSATTLKETQQNFFHALDKTILLWGEYGFDEFERAVFEASQEYKIPKNKIVKEIQEIEKTFQKLT